jgi:quercetin 2,3-dioxygenase
MNVMRAILKKLVPWKQRSGLDIHLAARRSCRAMCAAVLCVVLAGCTSITAPISGVPAHRLPPQFLAPPKNDLLPIDISRLRQTPPDEYLVDRGDILGIYVEGVLGAADEHHVAPGAGFPTHSHREMEIVTYVLTGALAHKDSTGTSTIIRAGDVQRMSAGTGISHSEYNPSETKPVHFLQIWIVPGTSGLLPSYEQRSFALQNDSGRWLLVAAPERSDGAVKIHQDCELRLALLPQGGQLTYDLKPGRHAWLQLAEGAVKLNGVTVKAGDGAAVSQEEILEIAALEPADLLLFDLA